MNDICYVRGDATIPQADGPAIIVHVCNDRGAWGRGFVLAISRRWAEPERAYREWHACNPETFVLGAVQIVQVEKQLWVANLIGQHGLRASKDGAPVRYDAILSGLSTIADEARSRSASVHMPRIGCGLAGGEWSRIEPIVQHALLEAGVAVTVYDLDAP